MKLNGVAARSMISRVKLTDLPVITPASLPPVVQLPRLFDPLFVREVRTDVTSTSVSSFAWRSDLFFLDLAGSEIGLSPGKV